MRAVVKTGTSPWARFFAAILAEIQGRNRIRLREIGKRILFTREGEGEGGGAKETLMWIRARKRGEESAKT